MNLIQFNIILLIEFKRLFLSIIYFLYYLFVLIMLFFPVCIPVCGGHMLPGRQPNFALIFVTHSQKLIIIFMKIRPGCKGRCRVDRRGFII